MSEDVDLFTVNEAKAQFPEAVTAAIDAFRREGFRVETALAGDSFVRLLLSSPDGRSVKVELGIDWRAHAPVTLAVGPVLHPDDAVGNKVAALYGRAEVRDFIDVEAILRSGRYTTQDLVRLATTADPGFEPEMFLLALNALGRLPDQAFAVHPSTASRRPAPTNSGSASRHGRPSSPINRPSEINSPIKDQGPASDHPELGLQCWSG